MVWQQIGAVLSAKDVIVHFLSDALSSDYSDAAGAGLIDYRVRDYSSELLALYDIEEAAAWLPPLRPKWRTTRSTCRLFALPPASS